MRVRKKKHANERINACAEFLIEKPTSLKENPQYPFEEKRPLHLEIGCGKGNFAVGMTSKHHDFNLIAMEKVADVAVTALEKAEEAKDSRPDNLRFIIGDAKFLPDYFPEHSIDTIYVNFCDPWPKKGHAKRRLTYHTFLDIYRQLLVEDGMLIFKTDNEKLFDFSMEEFSRCGLNIEWFCRDLHNSDTDYARDNVMTEYERNFSSKGMPIYSARVRFENVNVPLSYEEEEKTDEEA